MTSPVQIVERDAPVHLVRVTRSWTGLTDEFVRFSEPRGFEYRWQGDGYCIALHDVRRADGETYVDGAPPSRERDLRGTMTFVPAGCTVSGWSAPIERINSFTALYFDREAAAENASGLLRRQFGRAFRRVTGVAPSQYRQEGK